MAQPNDKKRIAALEEEIERLKRVNALSESARVATKKSWQEMRDQLSGTDDARPLYD